MISIKKYFHNRKLDKKIKYILKYMHGQCSHKVIDPELDSMIDDIENYMKSSGKYSYSEYSLVKMGIYHHKTKNDELEEALLESFAEDLKSKEPNVEETQNAICEAIERSKEDVR